MANEYAEFANRYTGGWGRIPLQKSDGLRTFKVLECRNPELAKEDMAKVSIEIITASKTTKELTYSYKYVLEKAQWFYPESKYVNTPNFVVRSVAYPARQYGKALTLENVYFSTAIPIALPAEIETACKQSVLDVLDNYDSPYPDYRVALAAVNSGTAFARAVAKRMLLTLDVKAEFPLLIFKNNVVGYDSGDVITLSREFEKLFDIVSSISHKGVIVK